MRANLLQTSSTKASADQSASGLKIALFLEEESGNWHVRRLAEALRARGAYVVITSLPRCAFDTGLESGIDIPGFGGALPDAVFVRSISAGTLEQITFRLGILHALRESGVRVWNDARAIERCVDKSTTTFMLQRAGLPVPSTSTFETLQLDRYGAGLTMPLVSKPLFGSQGNGIRRLDDWADLPSSESVNGVYHLQEYLPPARPGEFEDWRLFVSGGRLVSAMTRRGKQWVTNVHQGAEPMHLIPDARAAEIAIAAAAAVGADYAGVDMIRVADGRMLVLEVNSNPAWRGLQEVTDVDIAQCLADDFIAAVMPAVAAE